VHETLRADWGAGWRVSALRGDADAIGALADAALTPLYRFCFYRVGRDHHLCEEVVQETLVRAIHELAKYDPARSQGDVFPWLTGLARNAIRGALRARGATTRLEGAWLELDDELRTVYADLEASPLSDAHLQREETRELVNATMSHLPGHYRDALVG